MNKIYSQEHGQSAILIALGLAVLMAFMALAVDGGNVYAQRRQVQNAVDASAYAAAQVLANQVPNCTPSASVNCRAKTQQVRDAANKYAIQNGLVVDTAHPLSISYVYRDNSGNHVDSAHQIEFWSPSQSPAPYTITVNGIERPVVGVYVSATKEFDSFFASIVGIRTMTIGAPSPGYGAPAPNQPPPNQTPAITANGACCADNLFPVTIAQTTFTDENNDGIRDVHLESSDPSYNYIIWEKKLTAPGNFGYLMWRGQNSSATDLAAAMADTSLSGTYYVGDWVSGSTGNSNSNSVRSQWIAHIGQYITIPVYDQTQGTGNNLQYHIVGFARFKVTGFCRFNDYQGACDLRNLTNNSEPYVQGKFSSWTSSLCEGSCPNYGVVSTTNHPPLSQSRALIGVVKYNKLSPLSSTNQTQIPVDVVHILDVSGSMQYCVSTTTPCSNSDSRQKLGFAKSALINFNNVMSPTVGDRVGLATFPLIQSRNQYSYSCEQTGKTSYWYFGQNRINLTSNISAVNSTINSLSANGGTPLAGGLLVGRQMVLDPSYHDPSHLAVLIVASDGIANIRTNGQWTGFSGSTYNNLTCNSPAVQDAIDQANLAKSDNNHDGKPDTIIYSIAIGTDFNSDALRAISSEPNDQHFFTATDAATMQNIYNTIVRRIQSETCQVNQLEQFAGGVTVRIRNISTGQILSTTTTSTGFFEFNNIAPGTYEFQNMSITVGGLTYDIYTDGIGGPPLNSLPQIDVGTSSGTYEQNLSLKTDDLVCPAP